MFLQSFWKASYINSQRGGILSRARARARAHDPPHLSPTSTFTPYYRPRYTTLKDAFHCAPTSHRIRSMRLSCSHVHRKVNPSPPSFRVFPFTNGTFQWTIGALPSSTLLATKIFLSWSFLTSYSRSTIMPAPSHSTRATSFQTLSLFPRRNSQSCNLSFMKNQIILFLSVHI